MFFDLIRLDNNAPAHICILVYHRNYMVLAVYRHLYDDLSQLHIVFVYEITVATHLRTPFDHNMIKLLVVNHSSKRFDDLMSLSLNDISLLSCVFKQACSFILFNFVDILLTFGKLNDFCYSSSFGFIKFQSFPCSSCCI